MEIKERTKHEIETKLESMGEYVQIEYLERCLGKQLDFETKKFVLLKLSGIYENKSMFLDAAKLMRTGADINTTYESKIKEFLMAGGLFVKTGEYREADKDFASALACADENQKEEIRNTKKEIYKFQARMFESKDRRRHALEIYERLLGMGLTIEEKNIVERKLLELYDKLGKIKEYGHLKEKLGVE